MALKKWVKGEMVELSAAEEAAVQDRWAADDQRRATEATQDEQKRQEIATKRQEIATALGVTKDDLEMVFNLAPIG